MPPVHWIRTSSRTVGRVGADVPRRRQSSLSVGHQLRRLLAILPPLDDMWLDLFQAGEGAFDIERIELGAGDAVGQQRELERANRALAQ